MQPLQKRGDIYVKKKFAVSDTEPILQSVSQLATQLSSM